MILSEYSFCDYTMKFIIYTDHDHMGLRNAMSLIKYSHVFNVLCFDKITISLWIQMINLDICLKVAALALNHCYHLPRKKKTQED